MRGLERNKRNWKYQKRLREKSRNWKVSKEDERGIQEQAVPEVDVGRTWKYQERRREELWSTRSGLERNRRTREYQGRMGE